jgi:hypothetical protein
MGSAELAERQAWLRQMPSTSPPPTGKLQAFGDRDAQAPHPATASLDPGWPWMWR